MSAHRFIVMGSGPFPVDMLRHDMCWPTDSASAATISASLRWAGEDTQRKFRVEITGTRAPSVARWHRFHWQVVTATEYFDRNRRVG